MPGGWPGNSPHASLGTGPSVSQFDWLNKARFPIFGLPAALGEDLVHRGVEVCIKTADNVVLFLVEVQLFGVDEAVTRVHRQDFGNHEVTPLAELQRHGAAAFEGYRRLSDARRLGQLSHQLYVRLPMPGESGQAEVMGVDVWACEKGLQEHYASLSGYEAAFSAEPQTSVWEQADGDWREW